MAFEGTVYDEFERRYKAGWKAGKNDSDEEIQRLRERIQDLETHLTEAQYGDDL